MEGETGGGQEARAVEGLPQSAPEVAVLDRVGGREVEGTAGRVVFEQEADRPDLVGEVDPGDPLPSAP